MHSRSGSASEDQLPPEMNHRVKHVVLPLMAPAAIVGLYFTPVMVFGCVHRGVLALGVALLSAVGAFISIMFGFSTLKKRDPISRWWILSAAILTLPLALLLGPIG
jgi:hypothetical protein